MTRRRLEPGPVPLHHQVYLDLSGALDAGEWQAGDRLPTERDLADEYGCSLITVRRALTDLVRERRLERTRGRGTFVIGPPIEFPLLGVMSLTEEMRRQGLDSTTKVIGCTVRPAGEEAARALGVDPQAPVLALERLRFAGSVPLLLEQVRLDAGRFPGLETRDFGQASLYETLRVDFGVRIVRAREWIEPVLLGGREARLLEQEAGRPGLLIEGIADDQSGRPTEYGRSWVRGDGTRTYLERDVARIAIAEGADNRREGADSRREGADSRRERA